MDKVELYPLKFVPIYKNKIWGGTQIHEYKGLPSLACDVGESWEISPMPGDRSVVSEGALQGKDLEELVKIYGKALLGERVVEKYGMEFPLLVKLIYANEDLSIQVHPDDHYALHNHHCKGKTEMWYMLQTAPNACIYKGWNRQIDTEKELKDAIHTGKLMSFLTKYKVKAGDAFYLPAGTVHTIGKGSLLLEIQEASDITYRLYDFGRKDAEGNQRELHIEDALKVLDYGIETPTDNLNTLPISSEYFEVRLNTFDKEAKLNIESRDSFTILFCIEGLATVTTEKGNTPLRRGETLLLPASCRHCVVSADNDTIGASFIECFIP